MFESMDPVGGGSKIAPGQQSKFQSNFNPPNTAANSQAKYTSTFLEDQKGQGGVAPSPPKNAKSQLRSDCRSLLIIQGEVFGLSASTQIPKTNTATNSTKDQNPPDRKKVPS